MVNFGPRDTVPAKFAGRKLYQHNPTVTLMRTTPEENAEIGRRIATRAGASRGPLEVFLPLRGVSAYAKEGGPFHDPAADRRCLEAVKEGLAGKAKVREIDTDINDPEFARAAAETLIAMMKGKAGRN
jgi:uncharacterized protein (UPF0261 family)